MGSLYEYSGLTTKLKAMQGKLLSQDDYYQLAHMSNVSDVVSFLKNTSSYREDLAEYDTSSIHRGNLEKILNFSKYKDFAKIYNFSSVKQRRFLDVYFIRYETEFVKKTVRQNVVDDSRIRIDEEEHDVTLYAKLCEIYAKYSKLDVNALYMAKSEEDILLALKNTPYYHTLSVIRDSYNQKDLDNRLFDYEMAIDMFFFKFIWKKKEKLFKNSDLKNIISCIGTEIDTLNMIWIYRAKKFYKLSCEAIDTLLIPIHYKMRKEFIYTLCNAEIDEFEEIVGNSYYGEEFREVINGRMGLERVYNQILDRLYNKFFRNDPYSLAAINAYLHNKEREIERIITVTECVRYKYQPDEIMNQIY